jgi:hypothetical protein
MGPTEIAALSLDSATVLAMGLVVVTAYAGIWAIRKVISLSKV